MSRFQKLSHVIWHCQYHIVWVPKYRYKVLKGKIGEEVRKTYCPIGTIGLRNCRAECAGGSCPFVDKSSSQSIHISVDGCNEREISNKSVQQVSRAEAASLLG
jgi:hypothetical protein